MGMKSSLAQNSILLCRTAKPSSEYRYSETEHEIAGEFFSKFCVPIEAIIVPITHKVLRAGVCWVQRVEKYGLIPQDEENVESGVMFLVLCYL